MHPSLPSEKLAGEVFTAAFISKNQPGFDTPIHSRALLADHDKYLRSN